MKTLNELKEIARSFFIENGMTENGNDYFTSEKFEITTETRFNIFTKTEMEYTTRNGLTITITEVHRSNGTEANQSINVAVTEWERNSGRTVYAEKIYSRNSDKKIAAQLANVLTAYNN